MLETILQKYNNRYQISRCSEYFNNSSLKLPFKEIATSLSSPKPFIDGAVIGCLAGLVATYFVSDNYLTNSILSAVGFGLINQKQYYAMIIMDYKFDMFSTK